MMNRFKVLLAYLNGIKYYLLIFLVSFLIFFMFYFPGQRISGFIISNIATNGMTISATGNDMVFFPLIGVSADSARLKLAPGSPEIEIGKSSVGIPVTSLLIFSPSLKVDIKALGGIIKGSLYGVPIISNKKVDEILIDAQTEDVKLSELLKLWVPLLLDIDAKTKLKVEGAINTVNGIYSELNINADLDNIKIRESNLFGVVIPETSIRSGKLQAAVTNGELTIEKFVLGGQDEPVDISIRGKMSLKANMPYDFSLSVKLTGDMDKNLGNFLMLLPPQTKKPDGSYTFRLKGDSRVPVPQFVPM